MIIGGWVGGWVDRLVERAAGIIGPLDRSERKGEAIDAYMHACMHAYTYYVGLCTCDRPAEMTSSADPGPGRRAY